MATTGGGVAPTRPRKRGGGDGTNAAWPELRRGRSVDRAGWDNLDGTILNVRSAWYIDAVGDAPRFVTAHPLPKL